MFWLIDGRNLHSDDLGKNSKARNLILALSQLLYLGNRISFLTEIGRKLGSFTSNVKNHYKFLFLYTLNLRSWCSQTQSMMLTFNTRMISTLCQADDAWRTGESSKKFNLNELMTHRCIIHFKNLNTFFTAFISIQIFCLQSEMYLTL